VTLTSTDVRWFIKDVMRQGHRTIAVDGIIYREYPVTDTQRLR